MNSAPSSRASNDLNRWDLADILNPSSANPRIDTTRDRKMSLDFPHSQHGNGMYEQVDTDQGFNTSPDGSHHHHGFDGSAEGHTFGSGYRTNGSSSSSLGPRFGGLGSDSIYPPPSFADSPYTSNGHSYTDMGSYNGSKMSPLTPTDPGGLHHSTPFATKDFHNSNYPDLNGPDRRLSNVGPGHFSTEFGDDYPAPFSSSHFPGPERMTHRFSPPDNRFPHSHGSDLMRGVAPNATHSGGGFRHDPAYEEMPHYMSGSDMGGPRVSTTVDDTLRQMHLQPRSAGSSSDLHSLVRPFLEQYVRTTNRLAFGERTVIVMSSKVAQKSYGTEKRFLCPPPTAIMIGNSWWSETSRRGEEGKLCPPRVVISISGEPVPQEGSIEWTGSSGKTFDPNEPPSGTTFSGRCVGKQLFISDVDEKKKKVEALVQITAPATDDEPDRIIGTFPSRPIKVISKPSKKRQSAKNLELCINHGSTISLFHRLRSQTVSTKYLCVSGSSSSFKGSDGAPLAGLDQRSRPATPSFIARTASWDPFVMYIVDVNKPSGGIDSTPPPPIQPDYPSPPPNAIPFTANGSQIPIYYNQTVVLQCLTSGVVSPVLIIRKVDHQTTVVGGGLQDGAKGVADHYCAPAEVCGDPVSQLHKIAFEVYDSARALPDPGTPGASGAFLSCMGEKVNTYRPMDGRQWVGAMNTGTGSPPLPGSPIGASGSSYFQAGGSEPTSPSASPDFLSNDGGRVKKKRGSTSAGGVTKTTAKGRRRPSSAGSVSSRRGSSSDSGVSSGALWQVDIGETSVWTIVGTDQVRYNFYVPPVLPDGQAMKPLTPFPSLVKYLPPDRAAEAPKHHSAGRSVLTKPNPHAAKMLTVYGENFSKTDPVSVFFGADPSSYVEVRCNEVLGCLPPDTPSQKRRPLILVRSDGVVFPSNVYYP